MFGSLSKIMVLYCPKRYAGHSKWQNIRHIKGQKDSQKSTLFMSLCRKIKLAIHEGGSSNPALNAQLHQAVEVARKHCMPNSSIENCIKSGENNKAAAKSLWFEIRGPGGSFIIASVLTENSKRTRETIAAIMKKFHVSYADRACKHLFDHKGEIVALPPKDLTNSEEVVIDHAIECGAEEVTPNEGEEVAYKFICDVTQLNIVTSKLKGLQYDVKSAEFNFIPKTRVDLSDDDIETMSNFMDKLEEHPDVVTLYDNVA